MAGSTTAICSTFKSELLALTHNLAAAGDTLKMALIKVGPTGTYGAATTNAGTPGTGAPTTANLGTDEVTGTGYVAGGAAMTNSGVSLSGTTGIADFANVSWAGATFSATAVLMYNSSKSNKAIAVWDFAGTQTVAAATFTIAMPGSGAATSLIRIA